MFANKTKTCSKLLYKRLSSTVSYPFRGGEATPSMILQDHHLDTTIWTDFIASDNDIFIVSPAKCGSAWLSEIVGQLLYKGDYSQVNNASTIAQVVVLPSFGPMARAVASKDASVNMIDVINDQLKNPNIKHRIIKSHEPIETMPYNPNCKYIFLARDYRDIIWSFYNHFRNYSDYTIDYLLNRIDEPMQDRKYQLKYQFPKFDDLEKEYCEKYEYDFWKLSLTKQDSFGNNDGYPFWSQLWITGSWLNCKHYKNIKFLHYNELKKDLKQCFYDIKQFLELDDDDYDYDDATMDQLVSNCQFETMKKKSKLIYQSTMWKDPTKCVYKGINGRWKDSLTDDDIQQYRKIAAKYMTSSDIYWMENGTWQEKRQTK